MRRIAAILTLALLTTAALPVSAQETAPRIAEILPDPAEGDREFIEVWNPASTDVDLAGWTVSDTAGNAFTFGNRTLPAGGRVVVWGGGEDDARGPAWSKSSVWNNGGDQAFLHDAAGTLVDSFAYGSADWPDGRNETVPPAPATGKSLALIDGQWVEGQPTPGTVPDEQGGAVTATVEDVPPSVAFVDAPAELAPAQTATVRFQVDDPNGPDDVAAWTLTGDGAWLADGTDAGLHEVIVEAPSDRDQWTLELTATDQGGNASAVQHTVAIQVQGVVVLVPPGGLGFPAFPPGADAVVSNASFTLRNDANESLTPRIDVSDFSGPATIPVAGHLDIGTRPDSNSTWQWTPYAGPLEPLPALAPGESVEATLRLRELPTPLPAGTYGTSFTVVA